MSKAGDGGPPISDGQWWWRQVVKVKETGQYGQITGFQDHKPGEPYIGVGFENEYVSSAYFRPEDIEDATADALVRLVRDLEDRGQGS